ncbi:MAG: aminopeptidase, partial [Bacteroidetes bacterium QH_1_61_8]
NPENVGHGYDIEGDGTWRPSDGPPDADSLTWHFTAENVHNFAWSADPDYIHDKVEQNGTTHHILYKPEVAEQWTPLKQDMPSLTSFFSEEYGDYPYPQMTVAQGGDGGMEYPMFTVVTSYNRPTFDEKAGYRSVLGTTVHEFAHMWYYAALGSNEADYAWMDEGFTSYATSEGMAHLTGGTAGHSPLSIVRLQKMGLFEPLDTPADWYETNLGYGVASYPGGELYVDLLGYVTGEENRDGWLKRYFRERTFQHPDPNDLELFAEQESGLILDWYFYQFTESTRQLDDEIDDLETTRIGQGYEASFTLEREGTIRMPHDVKLTLEDGSTQWVNVP